MVLLGLTEHHDNVAGSGSKPNKVTTLAKPETTADQVATVGTCQIWCLDGEVGSTSSRWLASTRPSCLPTCGHVLAVPKRDLDPASKDPCHEKRGRRHLLHRRLGQRNPNGYLFSVALASSDNQRCR